MTTVKVCPSCEAEREFRRERRTEEYLIRGNRIRVPVSVEVCSICNESFYDEARDEKVIEQAYAKYREQKGLLSPQEIREIRKRYALSQKSFARLLGMSEATVNRYEGGGLQDEAHDTAIRAQSKPENMEDLLARRGHLLTKRQREKAAAVVVDQVKYPQKRT